MLTLMPCAVLVGWYAVRGNWPRFAAGIPFGLSLVFLASAYTTLNRTVWLGFLLQFALIAVLLLRRAAAPHARVKWIVIGLCSFAAAGGALVASIQVERRMMGFVHPVDRDSRLALWPEILERAGERPVLGYGFGRGLLRDDLRTEFGSVDVTLWHAHNLFLDALIQTGVPGILLLVLVLVVLVRTAWRMAGSNDDAAAACGIALIAMVVGMIVRNMTDSLLVRQNALLFWGLAGALLATGRRLRASATSANPSP